MNIMKLDLKKSPYLTIYFIVFIFSLFYRLYNQILSGYYKESWNITEWLINYQGGFVRRGLTGEILFQFNRFFSIDIYTTIIILSLFLFGGLTFFFFRSFVKNGYPIFILPCVFFMGNPILCDFWVRKDTFLLIIFIVVLYLVTKAPKFYLLIINILLILTLLIHESISFICFPILLFLLSDKFRNYSKRNPNFLKSFMLSALSLSPTLLVFLILILNNGDIDIANAIWQSWQSVDFPHNTYIVELPSAIDAISWTMDVQIYQTYQFLHLFSNGIYAPLALAMTIIIIYYILSNMNKLDDKILTYQPKVIKDNMGISVALVFQFCSLLFLFMFACDYSRTIFYWVASSFALVTIVPSSKLLSAVPQFVICFTKRLNQFITLNIGNSKGVIVILSLVVGIYAYSWDFYGAISNSSLYIVLSDLSHFIRGCADFF